MADAEPASDGATFVTLGLLLGSGRSVVPGADSVDQNVDESAPELAGTGTAEFTWLQEWGCEDVGLDIFHMPCSTRSCLGWSRCLDDTPRYAVVECMSLENIIPVALRVESRARTLWAWASPTVNLVSCDALPPPWGLLVGRSESLGGKLSLGWAVILWFYSLPLLVLIKNLTLVVQYHHSSLSPQQHGCLPLTKEPVLHQNLELTQNNHP